VAKLEQPSPELLALMQHDLDRMWGQGWVDRKRKWTATYPLVAKGMKKGSVVDRALELVQPPGPANKLEKWRKDFLSCAETLKRARPVRQYTPKERRELLGRAASALEEALKRLDELPPGYCSAATRTDIEGYATRLRNYEKDVRVPRRGGPQNPDLHLKVLAAGYAFDLLNDYVEVATTANDGKYSPWRVSYSRRLLAEKTSALRASAGRTSSGSATSS
jgi:hypothetical protein